MTMQVGRGMLQTQEDIRILLALEPSLFRQAMKASLDGRRGLHVVGEARDRREAIREAQRTHPDIVLLDVNLLGLGDASTISVIKTSVPGCKILVLSTDNQLKSMVGALEAGASGYLTQRSSISDLVEATKGIQRGDVPLPPNTLASILEALTQKRGWQDKALERISHLTPREREVLALLAQGRDKATIARTLVISPETVRTHFQNILVKLEVHSRLEAAAFVRRNHLMQELVPNKERLVRDSAASANVEEDHRAYT